MSSNKALLDFRWSHPKHLVEIAGTAEGLKRLADAASRAAAEGETKATDDGSTVVRIVREENLALPEKSTGKATIAILGAMLISYSAIGLLAVVGAYTTWIWLFSS